MAAAPGLFVDSTKGAQQRWVDAALSAFFPHNTEGEGHHHHRRQKCDDDDGGGGHGGFFNGATNDGDAGATGGSADDGDFEREVKSPLPHTAAWPA